MKTAIIGGGVIGGGWAARFLLNGWDVAVFDPDPEAERKIATVLDNARASLPALYDRPLPPEGLLTFAADLADAVEGADWVQESAPERLEIKRRLYRDIQEHLKPEAVLASSTSGFKPSDLQKDAIRPDQIIVAHPFNPVYLLPLVEVVGSDITLDALKAKAADVLRGLGMHPLILSKEIDGFIGNRLQEAIWRESLWMIEDGIATTQEIDEAILMSIGLRWAQMGQFESYRLGGGEAGMRHFLAQFGPSLQAPLSRMTDVPELDDELVNRIAEQSDAQSGHMDIRALERQRDASLVALVRALKQGRVAAGRPVRAHEEQLEIAQANGLPITEHRVIPSSWTDVNGHMNETHYLQVASDASDTLTISCGFTDEYVAAGHSHFTAETHIRYLAELHAGDEITVTTQVLAGGGKKTHLFHRIHRADGELAATVEMLLLHVDLTTRRTKDPLPEVARRLRALEEQHAAFDWPKEAGRAIRSGV